MSEQKQKAPSVLKAGLIYTYGLGDFSFTFFILFIGYYLMYYLTDVIVFPAALAAVLYTLVQTFESATILLSGAIIDRVRIKGGKYRPWLLIGGITCCLGTWLFFTRFPLSISAYTYIFPLFYLIAYWGYNFMWVGYRSLVGRISHNQNDTVKIAIAGTQYAVAATLIFSAVAVKLLYGFSTPAVGFSVSALVYGLVIVVCMLILYKVSKPYDTENTAADARKKVTLKDTLSCLTGPMIPFFISIVLRNSVSVAIPALMVYYFNCVIGVSGGITVYLSAITVCQIAAVVLIQPAMKIMNKITIFIGSGVFSVAVLCAAYFFGKQLMPFVILMALNNFSITFSATLTNAFITDIADYNEFERGLQSRGFTVSVSATSYGISSLIGGAIASFGLAAIGYQSGAAAQTPQVVEKIRLIMTFGSAGCTLLSLIPFFFYNLTEKKMEHVDMLKQQAQLEQASDGDIA